jgi:hypothetical protein
LILCVIDGDGTIFAQDFIASGQAGGREAAILLTQGLVEYMGTLGSELSVRGQVWVTIYLNTSGLMETLMYNGLCTADQFDAFIVGFNQASPLFSIVDVGYGKEAADAKIKGASSSFLTCHRKPLSLAQNAFVSSRASRRL